MKKDIKYLLYYLEITFYFLELNRIIVWVQSLYYDKDRNISGKLENLAK